MDRASYISDAKTQASVERQLSIIGEAAQRVSEPFRRAHPEVPWRQMIGQRHVLVHDYGRIDQDMIWALIERRLPELLEQLEQLLPPPPAV